MGGVVFAAPEWVHGFWLALLIAGVLAWLEFRGRERLGRFVSPTMQARLAHGASVWRRGLKLTLILATLLFGIAGLMRPQTPGGTEAASGPVGADIMVVLDVSRSMLAEDSSPNRLARAKADIRTFLDRVTGRRVGLVAFSGRASVMCPLTTDYGFFHLVMNGVDSRSAVQGGTRLGDAIRKGVAAFGTDRGVSRLLLLMTDGEDQDSFPLDAAGAALEAGVRIVAIGYGSEEGSELVLTDPETGARTAITDSDGVPVRSRLDGELLREVALRADGLYVPAGTAALDLDGIVDAHVEPMVVEAASGLRRRAPRERYPWMVLAAIACLSGSAWAAAPRLLRRARK